MKKLLISLLLLFAAPVNQAAVSSADFPDGTVWYLHADLQRMRDTPAGNKLWGWLQGEVFVDINDEIGIDVGKEVDRVTAFAHDKLGTVIVVDGPLTKATQDKLNALATLKASEYDVREYGKKTYYFAGDDKHRSNNEFLDDLDESAYFTFAVPGKMIIASREEQIRELMDNKGRIAGSGSHKDALFVLTADKQFVQAGLRADRFADDDDGWNSNILRNTEEAAFMIADKDGMLSVQAHLKSADARMAESIGSIVNGLISLQLFNSDLPQNVRSLIQSTKVEVSDSILSVSTVFDPEIILSMIEDSGNDDDADEGDAGH